MKRRAPPNAKVDFRQLPILLVTWLSAFPRPLRYQTPELNAVAALRDRAEFCKQRIQIAVPITVIEPNVDADGAGHPVVQPFQHGPVFHTPGHVFSESHAALSVHLLPSPPA